MKNYGHVQLELDELKGMNFPPAELGLQAVGLGFIRLPAGKGYGYTHRHRVQEEVYIGLAGEGTIFVDGELLPLRRGDVYRVAPQARRALHASGDEPLLVLCAGAVPNSDAGRGERVVIDDGIPDFDDIPPWYEGDASVAERNAEFKRQYEERQK